VAGCKIEADVARERTSGIGSRHLQRLEGRHHRGERKRMSEKRNLLALLCVGAALALGACGGDDGGGEGEEASPEEAVEQAVTDYGNADGAETCDYVAQEALDNAGGLEACEEAFQDSAPTEYDIQDVQINGDEATVTAERPKTGETEKITLLNEDGEWLVDPTR